MNQCAYCRSTPRNVATGRTVFCNDQCHDAYFGITDNPFHTPEALAAAGYDPCMNCGKLHQEDSDYCPACDYDDLNLEVDFH